MSPSKAEVVAYAHAVNLRASDVPRLRASRLKHERATTRIAPLGDSVEKCDGGVISTERVLGFRSPAFAHSNERRLPGGGWSDSLLPIDTVRSTVYVLPSAALASQEFAAADSPLALSCIEQGLASEAATHTAFFADETISELPARLYGIPVYALRLSAKALFEAPGKKGPSNFYTDLFGFRVGAALVTLTAVGDPHPVSSRTERRLLSLLYRRAERALPLLKGKPILIIRYAFRPQNRASRRSKPRGSKALLLPYSC